ncbi:methylase [Corynebacterium kutscheri]|uniref:DNA methyltransferase n=1 Tax=Corynebacterium kutscheri TaxID=35755 RepID=UPI000F714B0F|nr:DNA methyltransferase [Corynebacterium kutscheri]VEH80246.1 methylase [Corynebacterium kutscheri]
MSAVSHISRSDIIRNLNEFTINWSDRIQTWKDTNQGHTEKSAAQQFWGHLLRCFGVIPERIDLFERDAVRASTNNTGYIDLFWSSVVIGEAKSLGKDLEKAEKQALDYLAGGSIASHEWPKFIIVTNFETIQLTKLGNGGWTKQFPLEELADHVDQLMFLAGREEITKEEQTEASIIASRLMADLFTAMTSTEIDEAVGDQAPTNPEDEDWHVQKSSVFLTRILFLLYGDDSGLWENDLFYRFILHDTNDENLGSQLSALFQVLNTPENRRHRVPDAMAKFPYVNGSLFAEHWPQEFFDHDMRQALLNACRFNWTRISPAIFGSMFQLVKSKEARRADGEHYTSETNILKVIEPLFLDGLRKQASRLIDNRSTTVKALREFRDSLAEMAFCDPACGCGNFLVVAYRELRKIETDIIVAIREREGQLTAAFDVSWEQKLSIGQFYGFELNWWPAKIAETAMFLVDHQANRELALRIGNAPERLPISITAHIRHGNALRIAWDVEIPRVKEQTFIFGNPPFIGQGKKSQEQTEDMRYVWGKDYDGYLDYVTGWHAKSKDLLCDRKGEFAFVTTNSITQGQPVPALFEPLFNAGWVIKFAHRTFAWDSEAPGKAAVHCVIVGFTRDVDVKPQLWDYPQVNGAPVEEPVSWRINAYLVDGANVLVKKRSKPLADIPPAFFGSKPTGGGLIVEADDYAEVASDSIAAKYLRPFRMGRELVQGLERWCLWMADDDFDPADIRRSVVLKQRIETVRDMRLASKKKTTQESANIPHLFQENHQPKTDYVGIPAVVSESRNYYTAAHLDKTVIAGNKLYTAEDPEGVLFGLISSSMFITWQKTVGGRLESRLNFANTVTWNTFPVPELSEKDRTAIINGGKAVLEARAKFPHRCLADHYQPLAMDPDLLKAHDKLDKAVDKAFGAPRKLTSEKQRQELLFKNYAQLTQE